MKHPIQPRVRSHDVYQLEFKVDYELLRGRQTRYKINTYIFIPYSLGINSRTYTKSDFYRDTKNYVRLRTPRFTLDALLDKPYSPLVACECILQGNNWQRDKKQQDRLINSLKLLRPILNASLGIHLRRFTTSKKAIVPYDSPGALTPRQAELQDQLAACLDDLLKCVQAFTHRYRALAEHLDQPGVDYNIIHTYQLVDEAISLVIEESLLQTLQLAACYLPPPANDCYQTKISALIQDEIGYRSRHGYPAVLQKDSDNEEFLRRTSFLKKFTSSALYLSTSTQREGTTIEQILYAFAAGISMVFATFVAFYFEVTFGSFTFPVFTALVVGYMFKDRIKELTRALFAGYMRNFIYDQRTILRTLDGKQELGYVREKVTFVSDQEVPPDVMQEHHRDLQATIDKDGLPEKIICYSKEVILGKDAFRYIDNGELKITGIRDIMRYDVRPYLHKMASPLQNRLYFDGTTVQNVRCHKTYSIDFISVSQARDAAQPSLYQHTRVNMDRDGILGVKSFLA